MTYCIQGSEHQGFTDVIFASWEGESMACHLSQTTAVVYRKVIRDLKACQSTCSLTLLCPNDHCLMLIV